MIVLDASGAVEIARATAKGKAAQSLIESEESVVSCDLLNAEVANTFCKYAKAGLIDAGEARDRTDAALGLVDRFYPLSVLNREVVSEAVNLGHPAYDVYYLVLARRLGATLLTFDHKLSALCEQCGVSNICDTNLG